MEETKKGAEEIHSQVKEYYGKTLTKTEDLVCACCTVPCISDPLYKEILNLVPQEVKEKFYGCGQIFPFAVKDCTILDLGSGSGQDCYILSSLVGPGGKIIGVDMTDEQLATSRKHADDYCVNILKFPKNNMTFIKGYIEELEKSGIASNSCDLIVSNCVVNLASDKASVLKESFKCLKNGAEMYFSDVYSSHRLPDSIRKDVTLFSECLGGCYYIFDFLRVCYEIGFSDIRVHTLSKQDMPVEFRKKHPHLDFYSITFRLFKVDGLIPFINENMGDVVKYIGGIERSEDSFEFDVNYSFKKGYEYSVCSNTFEILKQSRFSQFFTFTKGSMHIGNHDNQTICSLLRMIKKSKKVAIVENKEDDKPVEDKSEHSCCGKKKEQPCCGKKKEQPCCGKKKGCC